MIKPAYTPDWLELNKEISDIRMWNTLFYACIYVTNMCSCFLPDAPGDVIWTQVLNIIAHYIYLWPWIYIIMYVCVLWWICEFVPLVVQKQSQEPFLPVASVLGNNQQIAVINKCTDISSMRHILNNGLSWVRPLAVQLGVYPVS